jgi:citrate synthase
LARGGAAEGRPGYEEAVFLLLTGELPAAADLRNFRRALGRRRSIPRGAWRIITERAENDDLMGALHTALSALHLYDPRPNSTAIRDVTRQCVEVVAKFPTLVAYLHQVARSDQSGTLHFVESDPKQDTAAAFLTMLQGGEPADPRKAAVLDLCLLLHAEHGGGNNSTFTVRTVSSARANTYMALCSGVASLSGYLHGGAAEAVGAMMAEVKERVSDWTDRDAVRAHLQRVLAGKAGDRTGKIYGFGHAVYTLSDPRARVLEAQAQGLAEESGRGAEFALYREVAAAAVELMQATKGRRVCPNVDFYSGFVYAMLGIPVELYTPLFAMARVAGWAAHRLEELIQGKLIRPSYASALPAEARPYRPLSER